MSKATAPFDTVPDQYLQDWIGASLHHPLDFGGDQYCWGVVQIIPGDMTYDTWGYLAKLKGYNGHVGIPFYAEAVQLWDRAGYGELDRQTFLRFTKQYVDCHTREAWIDQCRVWFGSDNVERALSDDD